MLIDKTHQKQISTSNCLITNARFTLVEQLDNMKINKKLAKP